MWPLFLAIVLVGWGAVRFRQARLQRRAFAFLERFERVPALGAYREGLSTSSFGGARLPHAVLLIHGYSASPAAFRALTVELERRGIPYVAPALTGFGLDDFRLLERATAADWRRDVRSAYEQLAGLAEEVSVVAISFGTLLAAELATERPVRELVLVAPYFFLKGQAEQRLAAWLARPWARALALALSPYLGKPLREGRSERVDIADPAHAARFFQYPSLPLRSLLEVWNYPRLTDFRALRCRRLAVCHGGAELTSDVPRLLAVLAEQGVAVEVRSYPRSAHNLFDDYEADQAASDVAALLV
jgi:carboxylesterase